MEERLELTTRPDQDLSSSTLYAHYRDWCFKNGHRTCSRTKFGQRLVHLGHDKRKTSKANVYPLQVRVDP